MAQMTPAEIIEKRAEIARVLCARIIYFEKNPHAQTAYITAADLENIPRLMLRKMIRKITP